MKACIIVGTRPEIIKMSPVIRACELKGAEYFVLHTGQHYSYELDRKMFEDLELKEPRYNLDVGSKPFAKQIGFMAAKIKEILKKEKPDIVFVQGPALISYLSIYYAHKFHKKTIFYTHTIAWELFEKFFPPLLNTLFLNLIKKLSIAAYNRCNEIFVPYYDLKKALAKAGVRTELTVARLGVDIEVFSPSKDKRLSKERLGINHGKMVIGYVGRVSKEKNTHLLLQAFRRLPHQENLHLLIVGDGPESQTREFKETANCTVTGFVGNVQDYLKAMDIFVMPSLTETTSLATLEAMASGLAVVVTKVGFIQNYVVKGYNGLFFPRNSSALLAIKMEQLIKERGLREQLGQNARKTIAYSFSWERSINKIKRLLLR